MSIHFALKQTSTRLSSCTFGVLLLLVFGFTFFVGTIAAFAGIQVGTPAAVTATGNLHAPTVQDRYLSNANFECKNGVTQVIDSSGQILTIPNGWVWAPITGMPKLISTRIQVTGDCDGSGFVDRLEGEDSFMLRSADIETEPEPGKPFDVAIYQQVSVTVGTDYSISGFMVSLCGGSAIPNDCPDGYYISKVVGLDPMGGTDPLADSVVWVENREPHVTVKYANLSVSAKALSSTMTAFIRVHSPFQWHGNHAIVDLFSMVEAPVLELIALPDSIQITGTMGIPTNTYIVQGRTHEIRWEGMISEEIDAIADSGGSEAYELVVTIEYQLRGAANWTTLIDGQAGSGCVVFAAPSLNDTYLFRARALAARPTTGGHRYPTALSAPVSIHFLPDSQNAPTPVITNTQRITSSLVANYLPVIHTPFSLVCQ